MKSYEVISTVKYAALHERQLWDNFRNGEREAFDFIYHKYIRLLYNYGIRISPDTVIVEDCIQDLFIEIWEKRKRLGSTDSIKYYLFKSLRRKITRKLFNDSKFYNRFMNYSEGDFGIILSHEQTLVKGESLEQQRKHLFKAMESLSKRQKEAVFLKYFEGLSYAEIASIMSIQTNAVYKLVCNAITVLREDIRKLRG